MTLAEVARYSQYDLNGGIQWVAIWKNGRSWDCEVFYPVDYDIDKGAIFEKEDYDELMQVNEKHRDAIMLNGYYTNCGADPEGVGDGLGTLDSIKIGIEWNYVNQFNTLDVFFSNCSIE